MTMNGDLDRLEAGLWWEAVAEGDAVVVSAKDELELAARAAMLLERDDRFVAAIARLSSLSDHERIGLVAARAAHVGHAKAFGELAPLREVEAESRVDDHGTIGERDRIDRRAVVALGERENDATVGGAELESHCGLGRSGDFE